MTVILANGTFPRKGGAARRTLESAQRIVACDGAADRLFRRTGRTADFVVGDMDSVKDGKPSRRMVKIAEQDTNDLTKAIRFCRKRRWNDLVIVGATGKREDHSLGNVFRAMEAGVPMVTDEGRFVPFAKMFSMKGILGSPISVFATDKATRMSSKGLEWSLDAVRFENLYCATLNRIAAKRVVIRTDRPAFVYLPHEKERR